MPPTATPVPAATILLVRDEPAFEVLMVRRHHQIDFASGALVFPGGKTHAGDHDARWSARISGWPGPADAARGAADHGAVREAYEETGILARWPARPMAAGSPAMRERTAPATTLPPSIAARSSIWRRNSNIRLDLGSPLRGIRPLDLRRR